MFGKSLPAISKIDDMMVVCVCVQMYERWTEMDDNDKMMIESGICDQHLHLLVDINLNFCYSYFRIV